MSIWLTDFLNLDKDEKSTFLVVVQNLQFVF